MGVLVKILGGSQTGAEFLLPDGDYVLGSGADADLVLVDAAVRPRHARLSIKGDVWRVEAVDGAPLRLGGQPQAAAATIAAYQVLGLGGVHLALGPDGPWSALPLIPAARDTAAATQAANASPSADGSASALPSPAAGPTSAPTAASGASTKATGAGADKAGKRRTRRRRLLAALVAIVAAAALYVFGPMLWRAVFPPPTFAERIARRLRADGFSAMAAPMVNDQIPGQRPPMPPLGGVALRPEYTAPAGAGSKSAGADAREDQGAVADGLSVLGLLPNDEVRDAVLLSLRRALDAVAASGMPVDENSLATTAEHLAPVQAALAVDWPALSLAVDASGFAARLEGVVRDPDDATAAYRQIRAAVDPRLPLRRRITPWPDMRRDLERLAERLGAGPLQLDWENDDIVSRRSDPIPAAARLDFLEAAAERYGVAVSRLLDRRLAPAAPDDAGGNAAPGTAGAAGAAGGQAPFMYPGAAGGGHGGAGAALLPAVAPQLAENPEWKQLRETVVEALEEMRKLRAASEAGPDAAQDEAPGPAAWTIVGLTADGFVDQRGVRWRAGDALSPTLFFVRRSSAGAVFQRGDETLIAGEGVTVLALGQ